MEWKNELKKMFAPFTVPICKVAHVDSKPKQKTKYGYWFWIKINRQCKTTISIFYIWLSVIFLNILKTYIYY